MSGRFFFAAFERALKEPFRYGDIELRTRRGFLVSRQPGGAGLVAEAAPLPSHSPDTFEQLEAALEGRGPRTASLDFALSCLSDLSTPGPHEVHSNFLVPLRSPEDSERALGLAMERGYTHCKLKVSPENLEQVPQLMKVFPRARYRLDANGALSPELLSRLLHQLDLGNLLAAVDYLEEPYSRFWDQPFSGPKISFAADETAALSLLTAPNPPSVFILKPAALGSLEALSSYLDTLRRQNVRAVVTTTLEAEPGRRALLRYLSRREHEVAGLSTGFLFAENYLPDQPAWTSVPGPSEHEAAWTRSLRWKEAHA